MAIIGRRNAPHATLSVAKFRLLFLRVLVKTVWRIRDDSMNRILILAFKPIQTILVEDPCVPDKNGISPVINPWQLPLENRLAFSCRSVDTSLFTYKQPWRVQPQVGPYRRSRRRANGLTNLDFYFFDGKRL